MDKVNREILLIVTGNSQNEATEGVTKLDIMSTERLGHYNSAQPRPIIRRM